MAEGKPSFARVLFPGDDRSSIDVASDILGKEIKNYFWAAPSFPSSIADIFRNDDKGPKVSNHYVVADIDPSAIDDVRKKMSSSEKATFLLHGDVIFSRRRDDSNSRIYDNGFSYMAMYHPANPYGQPATTEVSKMIARRERDDQGREVDGLYLSSMELLSKCELKFHLGRMENSLCIDLGGNSNHAANQKYCRELFEKHVVRQGISYEKVLGLSILDRIETEGAKRMYPRQRLAR